MHRADWFLKVTFMVIAVLLGAIALHPYVKPDIKVLADSGRFNYVYVVSPMYLYQGHQGVLIMDERNGNVWFVAKVHDGSANIAFKEPVFVARLPLEKLDDAPR